MVVTHYEDPKKISALEHWFSGTKNMQVCKKRCSANTVFTPLPQPCSLLQPMTTTSLPRLGEGQGSTSARRSRDSDRAGLGCKIYR
jgi:hypothetical protein